MTESIPDSQTGNERWQRHLAVTEGGSTAVSLLAAETPLSKQKIKQLMSKGAVWLTRKGRTLRLRRATKALLPGDELHVYLDEQVLARTVSNATLIADEREFSVWYKPYGMLSQGSKWGDHCTLTRFAEKYFQPERPAFLVHRLDRAATGLMLIAHSKKAAAQLSKAFQQRNVEKRYQVVVVGQFPENEVLMEDPLDGKSAKSVARLIRYNAERNLSLLEVSIETGRKHQIRRHLSARGFPVLGDRLYGQQAVDDNLQLCAVELVVPVNGEQRCYSLPEALGLKA